VTSKHAVHRRDAVRGRRVAQPARHGSRPGAARWISALSAAALALACAPSPAEEHPREHAEARSRTSAWVVVERPSDASLLELPAKIVAAADSRARIDVPLRGVVVEVLVQIGDRVEVGDALIAVRMPEAIEAAAILAGTNAQIGAHKTRQDRLEQLKGQGLVGAGEVFEVETGIGKLSAERRLALATLAAAGVDADERKQLLRRGTVIMTAPITGVIAELDAIPGDVVDPGESLAQILGEGRARIEVAFTGALPSEVELEFVYFDRATAKLGFDERRLPLAATPVATAIEPGLGRTLAWYEPANAELLAHGVRGRVILRGTAADLLEVPRRALRLHEGKAWVGRRPAEGGEPELVEVEVLRSVGSSALIRSPQLRAGDRVAADAATVLLLGRDASEFGEGHEH
jgi:membrane fusion protein, heavy metal efflux system